MKSLRWLPEPPPDWRSRLRAYADGAGDAWGEARALAGYRLDFTRTNALDEARSRRLAERPAGLATRPVRLGIAASCTTAHLHAGIRVAGLRRDLWIETTETDYGQYRPALADRQGAFATWHPDVVLLLLDAHHLAAGVHAGLSAEAAAALLDERVETVRACWRDARGLGAGILHATALPVFPPLLGAGEHRLPGSRARFLAALGARLAAEAEGLAEVLPLGDAARFDGLGAWYDPALWDRSKQEVAPAAAPAFGELVSRVLAARQGLSRKCLVLDLDNTVWGGVVGDDGVDGIVVGQGSALGEGFVALQEYAKDLARRGVILAVCSKNDEANALEPFDKHPDMILRRNDIAAFQANWNDKPGNIRAIAADLNIGLDSLVFLDDNPFERDLVRENLPMVAVPEWDGEPAHAPYLLAEAGYFEALRVTDEDRERAAQYQENRAREAFRAEASDMDGYLRGLAMRMIWRRFDALGRARIVQLINKTNQFNLTTRRYTEADVDAVMGDPRAWGLQIRLLDRFGDNGIISVVIGRMTEDAACVLDTWLMSCRILGRQVETTTLNLVADIARSFGARRLIGEYRPTAKNGMVRDHYPKLGFAPLDAADDGSARYVLGLDGRTHAPSFIEVSEG